MVGPTQLVELVGVISLTKPGEATSTLSGLGHPVPISDRDKTTGSFPESFLKRLSFNKSRNRQAARRLQRKIDELQG
jgi:hypothetical protein